MFETYLYGTWGKDKSSGKGIQPERNGGMYHESNLANTGFRRNEKGIVQARQGKPEETSIQTM